MNTTIKRVLHALLVSMIVCSNLQLKAQMSYTMADEIAANFDDSYKDIADLADQLASSFSTEEEKARVLYMWIAHNVRYDCRSFHNPPNPQFKGRSQEEVENARTEWMEEKIEKALKGKKGICEDYSRLYKAMCDEVGLEAVVIRGDARNYHSPFRSSHNIPHAWNAVKIDDSWYLLDATWGAGFTDAQVKKFTRRVHDGFFFTTPTLFGQSHWPEDDEWQLLDHPLSKSEFASQPMVELLTSRYAILDFAPRIINVSSEKNKKRIWLVFETTPKEIMVTTKKGKPIEFTRIDKDGKVKLTFVAPASGSIAVYGGESLRNKMDLIVRYEI